MIFLPQGTGTLLAQIRESRFVNPMIFALGNFLKHDVELDVALDKVAKTSGRKSYKIRLENAANSLRNGEDILSVIGSSNLRFFPKEIRVIIASDLSNKNKGILLCDWNKLSYNLVLNRTQIGVLASNSSVFFLTAMSLMMFVIPQFNEIALGLNVALPTSMKYLKLIGDNLLISITLFVIIFAFFAGLGFFIIKYYFNVAQKIDYANLLKLLSIINRDEFNEYLPLFSSKILFPVESNRFGQFANLLADGIAIEEAGKRAKIDKINLWYIKLGLIGQKQSNILQLASRMIRSKIETTKKSILSVGFSIIILAQGLFMGFVVYAVFNMMITLLVAGM